MSETAEKSKNPIDEAAESRAAAAAAAKAKQAALDKAAAERAAGKGPKIYALVNMMAKDGTNLVSGQETFISKGEYERLKSEVRFAKKPSFYDSGSPEAKEAAFKAKMMADAKPKPKKSATK